jgi:hypothetical protein
MSDCVDGRARDRPLVVFWDTVIGPGHEHERERNQIFTVGRRGGIADS